MCSSVDLTIPDLLGLPGRTANSANEPRCLAHVASSIEKAIFAEDAAFCNKAEGCFQTRVDARPRSLDLRGETLGPNRPIRPKDGPVLGSDAEIDGLDVRAGSPEDFNHLGLKDDAAASTVEIVGAALENIDVPATSAQQIPREEPTERPTDDQGPSLVEVVHFRQLVSCFSGSLSARCIFASSPFSSAVEPSRNEPRVAGHHGIDHDRDDRRGDHEVAETRQCEHRQ
jgi:hypothetical protein